MKMDRAIVLILLAVFYAAYFMKIFVQRKHGIQTMQMGKGIKTKQELGIERGTSLCTIITVCIELVSIQLNTQRLGKLGSVLGIILIVMGTIIYITAMITMKDSWRAGTPTEDKTELVTEGIYHISRNPAFLGFDMVYIGVAVAFTNIILVIISCITVAALHRLILQEESFLTKRFGQIYLDYKKEVGRYLLFI